MSTTNMSGNSGSPPGSYGQERLPSFIQVGPDPISELSE